MGESCDTCRHWTADAKTVKDGRGWCKEWEMFTSKVRDCLLREAKPDA